MLPDTSRLDARYPALSDLRDRARRRVPHFVWEYLDSGTGGETTVARNRAALDRVLLRPAALTGERRPDLATRFLGRDHPLPLGIAPVGMSGLVWPEAELHLARLAAAAGIPYCLSTVAAETPEAVGPHAGETGWFQLYAPRDPAIRADILRRAREAGFRTLVLTADVPVASRRERQTRGGLTNPPRLTPRLMAQVAVRPAWALATWRRGMPRLRLMESYSDIKGPLPSNQHIGYLLRTSPDPAYLGALRDAWEGPLVVKGILTPEDALAARAAGADAIWVSNHAGRQFDAAPAAIDCLPAVRAAVGPDCPIVFDSGIASGLDVLRALALGADFVMLGRAFHYGLAALGPEGAAHVLHILRADMVACMGQMGVGRFGELAARVVPPSGGVAKG